MTSYEDRVLLVSFLVACLFLLLLVFGPWHNTYIGG